MVDRTEQPEQTDGQRKLTRRQWLGWGALFAAGWGLAGSALWWRRHERGHRADVFIGKAANYDADLVALLAAGLKEIGVTRAEIKNKRVLLKPNLVETAVGIAHINTHPALVVAAAEVFRRLDARNVFESHFYTVFTMELMLASAE